MPLPPRQWVEDKLAEHHDRHRLVKTLLILEGISRALRARGGSTNEEKAREIDLEAAALDNVLARFPDGCAGADLSTRLCTWLACYPEPMLADCMGIQVEDVVRGITLQSSALLARLSKAKGIDLHRSA